MEVDSWIQANTLIVGWKFYNIVWSLLVATGLVFIPLLLIIARTFLRARERGAMSNINSEGVLSEFEMKMVTLFLVFFFVAMPASVGLQAGNTIRLFNDNNDLLRAVDAPANGGACNTGSTADANVSAPTTNGSDICNELSLIHI